MPFLSAKIPIASECKLESFASDFCRHLSAGLSIGLEGELGAGKTTFVRYLVSSMGSGDAVSSPTFTLEHEYHAGSVLVEHWDLYRLKDVPDELFETGSVDCLRLIEWSDKFPEIRDRLDAVLRIEFDPADPDMKARLLSVFWNEGTSIGDLFTEHANVL